MENIYEITITLSRKLEEINKTELFNLTSKSINIKISDTEIHFVSKGNKKAGKNAFSKILSILKKYGLFLGKLSLLVANNQWIIDSFPLKKSIDIQSLFNEFGEEVNQTNFTSFIFSILPILKRIFSKRESNVPTIIISGDNNIIKEIKISHIVNK